MIKRAVWGCLVGYLECGDSGGLRIETFGDCEMYQLHAIFKTKHTFVFGNYPHHFKVLKC